MSGNFEKSNNIEGPSAHKKTASDLEEQLSEESQREVFDYIQQVKLEPIYLEQPVEEIIEAIEELKESIVVDWPLDEEPQRVKLTPLPDPPPLDAFIPPIPVYEERIPEASMTSPTCTDSDYQLKEKIDEEPQLVYAKPNYDVEISERIIPKEPCGEPMFTDSDYQLKEKINEEAQLEEPDNIPEL